MTWHVLVIGNTITAGPRALPRSWRRPNGQLVRRYDTGPAWMHAADGWRECPDRPAVEWWQAVAVALDETGAPVWVVSDRHVEEVRAERLGALGVAHAARMQAGAPIVIGETEFRVDCDDVDVGRWNATLALIDLAGMTSVDICDFDNTPRALSAADYRAMCVQVGAHVAGLWAQKWTIRAAIMAAQTAAEVAAVAVE